MDSYFRGNDAFQNYSIQNKIITKKIGIPENTKTVIFHTLSVFFGLMIYLAIVIPCCRIMVNNI